MPDKLDVLVVGPTYLDRVIMVEKLGLDTSSRITREDTIPGGTGFSYARNLALLGYSVGLYSILGTCSWSDRVREVMREYGIMDLCDSVAGEIDEAYVMVDKTGNKFAASKRKISRYLMPGASFEEALACSSSLIITSVRSQCARSIFKRFRKNASRNVNIFFAPNRHLASHPGVWDCVLHHLAVDVLTLSSVEWEAIPQKMRGAVRRSLSCIAVTEGKNGHRVYCGGAGYYYPSLRAEIQLVSSTNGAGEAFGSGLWAGMQLGLPFREASRFGSFCAAQALQQEHCIPQKVSIGELLMQFRQIAPVDWRQLE